MRRLTWHAAGVVAAGLLGGALAGDHDDAQRLRAGGVVLPLQQVIASDAALAAARILEVGLEHEAGSYRYEIEYLDADGRVWEGLFDATTGERLRTEQED